MLTQFQNGFSDLTLKTLIIGVGSALAGYVSRGKIQYGLVTLGAIGMALASVPMGIYGITTTAFSLCLVGLGLCAGLFIVPIAAVLQHRPAAESRGAVQGAANLLSFIAIFAVSGVQIVLQQFLHLSPGEIFWVCGAIALASGFYVAATRPGAVASLLGKEPLSKEVGA